ncbi:MAG: hypothetical protein U0230_08840 [Polyangiales bacterium]
MKTTSTQSGTDGLVRPDVPDWLRTTGMVLGWLIVPPVVIPILLLIAALGTLVFWPFLPPLFAEFVLGSAKAPVDEALAAANKPTRALLPRVSGPRVAHP